MIPVSLACLFAIIGVSFGVGVVFTSIFAWVAGQAWVQNVKDAKQFGQDVKEQGDQMFRGGLKLFGQGTVMMLKSRKPQSPSSDTPGIDAVAEHIKEVAMQRLRARGNGRRYEPSDLAETDERGFVPTQEDNPHVV